MSRLLSVLLITVFSIHAYAWTITENYDERGFEEILRDVFWFLSPNRPSNDKPYDIVDTQAHTGQRSLRKKIEAGATVYTMGAVGFKYPEKLGSGKELWFRMYVYIPNHFNFIATPWSTVISIAAGKKEIKLLHTGGGKLAAANEVDFKGFLNRNPNYKTFASSSRGVWSAYEIYVKFSANSGNGVMRVWKDGKMEFEDTETPTLPSNNDKSNRLRILGRWNGGSPITQYLYIDSLIITSDRPSSKDANGNPFIGTGAQSQPSASDVVPPVGPPNPPTITN